MNIKKIIFWVILMNSCISMPMQKNGLFTWEQLIANQVAHDHLAKILSHLSPALPQHVRQPEECISNEGTERPTILSNEQCKMLQALSHPRRVSRPVQY